MDELGWNNMKIMQGILETVHGWNRTGEEFECGALTSETRRFTKYMWQGRAFWTNHCDTHG